MAIRAVGFDYLGVTAHLTGRSVFDLIAERLAVRPETVRDAYQQYNNDFQRGEITEEELWTLVARVLERPDDLPIILAAANETQPQVDPAMIALIDEVRAAGFKTGLLSNLSTGTTWEAGLYAQGVDRHFDSLVLSGDLGFAKPDIRAFQALADDLEVDFEELMFIDDRASSMAGIDEVGIIPLVFDGTESLRDQLRQLEIL